ncbi:MAG: hypothetical protein IJP01_02535, partial [Oscillospiraceae bacterium]|nr:hypothetical protein [Oscillospiraceae bacterium]
MKKRLFAVLLVLALALSLAACSAGGFGGYKPSKEWKQIYNEALELEKGEGYPWEDIFNLANQAIFCDPAVAEGYILAAKYARSDAEAYAYLHLGLERAAVKEDIEAAVTEFRANRYVLTPQEVVVEDSRYYSEQPPQFAFDSEGRIVSYSGADTTCTWAYDANDRITFVAEDKAYDGSYSYSYVYNEEGLLLSAVADNGWYREENSYDPQAGRLLASASYQDEALYSESTYSYDQNTVTEEETYYDTQSGNKSGSYTHCYSLDMVQDLYLSYYTRTANGDKSTAASEEVMVEMEAWFDDPLWQYPLLISTEAYDRDGEPWYKNEYTWWLPQDDPEIWSVTEKSELSYEWSSDKNEWLLAEEVYYNMDGNETLEVEYYWDWDGNYAGESRLEAVYCEGDWPLESETYTEKDSSGSVTQTVVCTYTYDDENRKENETYVVYDASGAVVNTLSVVFEYKGDDYWAYKESYYLNDAFAYSQEETSSGYIYTYADGTT